MSKQVKKGCFIVPLAVATVLAALSACDMVPTRSNSYDPANNTDTPGVVSTVPARGARGVPVSQSVSATFNEDIYELSVDHTSFVVLDSNRAYVAGKITCEGRTITFKPHIDLASAQTYTVVITASVTDYALNAMSVQFEWSFCTAPGYVPDMVLIEGGSFTMGNNSIAGSSETTDNPEFICGPEHPVEVDSFYLGTHEVTVQEYAEYCVSSGTPIPSAPFGGGTMPVIYVSWYDAVRYCNWLSDVMGYERCYSTEDDINYTCDFSRNGYRLPTEAEWEFAARNRGATQGNQHSGYDVSTTVGDMAWYSANSNGGAWPVGSKSPNGLGIYDISGNVREWCWDWHEYWIWYYDLVEGLSLLEGKHYYERCYDYSMANSSAPVVNPAGYEPEEGWPLYNAIRGGSWELDEFPAQTAVRSDDNKRCCDLPIRRREDVGFRICRSYTENGYSRKPSTDLFN